MLESVRLSLVFLEALVDPRGLPRPRFTGGTLALSVRGSCVGLGGRLSTTVVIGSSGWGLVQGLS